MKALPKKLLPLTLFGIVVTSLFSVRPVQAFTMFGGTQHQLVFTENPDGSLTVTFDGSSSGISIQRLSRDAWTFTLPFTATGQSFAQWFEPENSSLVNVAQEIATDTYLVNSDGTPSSNLPIVPNGTSTSFGTDPNDNVAIQATFNDNAAKNEHVPDTGSTLGLLFLGLTGLLGATRLRLA